MSAPLVICAIFRDEALYLREWIEFHRIVGVSKVFLYNNRSADNYEEVLAPYIEEGIVSLTQWPGSPPIQCEAYRDFIVKNRGQKMWAAFIDVDEFLFSPIADKVTDVLAKYDKPMSLGVNWVCFGSGGQDEYEPKPVIERFFMRPIDSLGQNNYIKSIVRLDQVVHATSDPHFFIVQSGNFNENGVQIFGSVSEHTSNILRLNHYKSKSKAEWEKREHNGKPNAVYAYNWDHFYSVNTGELTEDRVIQRFLPLLKEKLCQ